MSGRQYIYLVKGRTKENRMMHFTTTALIMLTPNASLVQVLPHYMWVQEAQGLLVALLGWVIHIQ